MKRKHMNDDIEGLKKRCSSIVTYLLKRSPESIFLQETHSIVQKLAKDSDRTGLITVSNDLNEMIKGIPPNDLTELNALLEDYSDNLCDSDSVRIDQILSRGSILNDSEYTFLETYIGESLEVKEVEMSKGKTSEINDMLLKYYVLRCTQ